MMTRPDQARRAHHVDEPDLLASIMASTRWSVDVRMARRTRRFVERLAARVTPHGDRFLANLARLDTVNVIAECKRRSPSRGVLRAEYDPVGLARAYQQAGAAAISVLTEPAFFDGSLEHLRAVRQAVDLPILCKDFVLTDYQLLEARAAGADAALVIVAALDDAALVGLMRASADLGLAALVEVHDGAELDRALDAGASLVGVNNRNLRTLEVVEDTACRLGERIPAGVIAVAESGLRTPADLTRLRGAGYRAFLVGEALVTTSDPAAALRRLLSVAS